MLTDRVARLDIKSGQYTQYMLPRPTNIRRSVSKVWRRGESNPRPKSATARSLHAYRIRFISPDALGTRKTRCRLVRLISPENHGPRSAGQPTVWRLDPSPWTKLGETGYARFF